uniref:Uncharacterized protein n=1 Tax=Anas platyrhynchos platyrhynchos TaxID=8840 RepID=A0A493T7E1_ANAPP
MRAQVQQKDVGRRLQVGQELLEYLRDPAASPDVEQDPQRLDKVIDELAAWVNSSNFKVCHTYEHGCSHHMCEHVTATGFHRHECLCYCQRRNHVLLTHP